MTAPSTENDPRNKCWVATIVKMPSRYSRHPEVAASRRPRLKERGSSNLLSPSRRSAVSEKKKGRSREQPFHCQAVARLREAMICLTRMSR
jgi:hypothetical protein